MDKGTFGKKLLNNKKLLIIAAIAAIGVLMLVCGGGEDKTKGKTQTAPEQDVTAQLEEYRESLRYDIARLCEQVGGVSDVTVAVSLECGFEYVYATDSKSDTDSYGSQTQIKYITVGNGSSESAVYITEKLPRIGGIGVVCRGGSDPVIIKRLTALLSAAYNIGSNKIYVTGT